MSCGEQKKNLSALGGDEHVKKTPRLEESDLFEKARDADQTKRWRRIRSAKSNAKLFNFLRKWIATLARSRTLSKRNFMRNASKRLLLAFIIISHTKCNVFFFYKNDLVLAFNLIFPYLCACAWCWFGSSIPGSTIFFSSVHFGFFSQWILLLV